MIGIEQHFIIGTPVEEVEAIARKLTKAQREALLGRRSWEFELGMWPLRNSLRKKRLIASNGHALLPLGLAVRQLILEQDTKR